MGEAEFLLSLLPVGFVLIWPWLLVLAGQLGLLHGFAPQLDLLHGFLLWFYPWGVTGAIWTVMTQVSHVQEDCQRPPTGSDDDYFRWQATQRPLPHSPCPAPGVSTPLPLSTATAGGVCCRLFGG